MANKISNVLAALVTALNTLVEDDGTGTLKSVVRRVVNMHTEVDGPIVGLVPMSMPRRSDRQWYCDCLVQIAAAKGDGPADQVIIDLIAAVQDAIDAAADADAALGGGVVMKSSWDLIFLAHGHDSGVVPVGAVAQIQITVEDPLLVE